MTKLPPFFSTSCAVQQPGNAVPRAQARVSTERTGARVAVAADGDQFVRRGHGSSAQNVYWDGQTTEATTVEGGIGNRDATVNWTTNTGVGRGSWARW